MKLMTLNLWGGKLWNNLKPFLKEWSDKIDIFLFQEVLSGDLECPGYECRLYEMLENLLPKHRGVYFRTSSDLLMGREFNGVSRGIAAFFRKGLRHEVVDEWKISENAETGVFQSYLVGDVCIMNVHGFCKPTDKNDSPETLLQSRMIIESASRFGKSVIAGDFNLNPGTKSISMLEESGWINLIREYGIKTTRNRHSPLYGMGILFSDYVFTSGVDVFDFKAIDSEVSDHLPLVLEFEP